ncbi:hypothetical protein JB92DRAFT_3054799 [Gautieria morchelliformis]|nr:hypothetical protein JB92DRAFT_3054799 [Gautieria morchelliformis]
MENQLPFLHSLGLLHRELMTLEEDRRLFMQPIHLRPLGVGAPGFLAPPAPLLHPPLEPQPYPRLPPHPLPAFQPLARPLPIPALSSPADNPASPAPFASRGDRDRRRRAKAMARLKSEEATSHLSRGGSRPRRNKQRCISVDTQPDLGARSRSTPPGEELAVTEEEWARSVGSDCSFWSSTPSRSCQTTPCSGNVFIRGHP